MSVATTYNSVEERFVQVLRKKAEMFSRRQSTYSFKHEVFILELEEREREKKIKCISNFLSFLPNKGNWSTNVVQHKSSIRELCAQDVQSTHRI